MYSIVMLMAMSSGGEVADCHRHRCHGCSGGCYGCGGCYGGGCYGGGCYGGGCYGGGGYGCAGCSGCYGGTIVAPAEKKGGTEEESAPAKLIVSMPAKAKLSINGTSVKSSDKTRRVFVSPKLAGGREYYYNLKVVVNQDGKPVTVQKRVTVRAGSKVNVQLAPQSSVALR